MPAKSRAQQQAFGIARAIQKGERPATPGTASADIARSAKPGDVRKFAKTKHKGLPRKVKSEGIERLREFIRRTVQEVLEEKRVAEKKYREAYDPAAEGATASKIDALAAKHGLPGIKKGESRDAFHARVRKALSRK